MDERAQKPDDGLTVETSADTSGFWAGIERFRTAVMLAMHPDLEVLDDELNVLYGDGCDPSPLPERRLNPAGAGRVSRAACSGVPRQWHSIRTARPKSASVSL
ncbi:hypothetical protein [Streptomyces sp. DT203]|uniref:hypothetical protein n=1 Tax=Streptomyces sp. DT203 TaxID=3393424 RepID=UPI003CEAB50A